MHNQKGFSLIQLMIVIAISITLVSIGMAFYRDSRNTADFKDLNYNLSSIYFNVSNLFARGETKTLNTQQAYSAGLIPSAMSFIDGEVKNVFGGNVRIYGRDNPNKITPLLGVRAFEVHYYNVPQSLCSKLINNQIKIGWHGFSVVGGNANIIPANTKYKSTDGMALNFDSGSEYILESEIIKVCSFDDDTVNLLFFYDNDI